jgi:hypothetical protein
MMKGKERSESGFLLYLERYEMLYGDFIYIVILYYWKEKGAVWKG